MRSLLFALMLLIVIAGPPVQAQSGNDLFQKALSKERVEGQLAEAIALYQRVLKEFGSDRALAARALVQMGRCFERLGRVEAQATYERVVRDFGEQTAAVTEARSRLAALTRPAASPPRTAFSVRQLRVIGLTDAGGSIT